MLALIESFLLFHYIRKKSKEVLKVLGQILVKTFYLGICVKKIFCEMMALEFSIISSGSPALDVPDLSDGQVGHATAVSNGLHLLGDVLLTRALDVDVEAV